MYIKQKIVKKKKLNISGKKFLDPNIKNKSKTVEDKIQLYTHHGMELPLPTEIEISGQEPVIDLVLFVLEVLLILWIKRNLLAIIFMKNYVQN